MGRTQRADPYQRVMEQNGFMVFCIWTKYNRRLERVIHLFFRYANITKIKEREWFQFQESLNIGSLVCQINEIVTDAMDQILRGSIPKPHPEQKQSENSRKQPENSRVDLNRATKDELMTLPGIGKGLAERIIQHRKQYGPFYNIEALMDVPYIKWGRYLPIKDLITVD